MSLIRLYSRDRLSTKALAQLRAVTGKSITDLDSAFSSGAPVAEFVLFKKDHNDVAARIRRLVESLLESDFTVFECVVDSRTGVERCHPSSFAIIGNILNEAEQISRDLDAQ